MDWRIVKDAAFCGTHFTGSWTSCLVGTPGEVYGTSWPYMHDGSSHRRCAVGVEGPSRGSGDGDGEGVSLESDQASGARSEEPVNDTRRTSADV